MPILNAAARQALAAGHLAHLVTIAPDGAPQISIVWIGIEDDEIVVGHLGAGHKLANIARDPRVALSLETGGADPIGLAQHLIVHGTATLQAGGAPELLQRLAEVYLGPGVRFPPMDEPPPGHVIRITPTRIAGVGPWSD